jgi:type VI secretion system secreted protein Hcp
MIFVDFKKKINGTSDVKDHDKWIEFDSYAFNASRSIQGHGTAMTTSHAHVSELMLTKQGDITSPELFAQAVVGATLEEANIVVKRPQGAGGALETVVKITLTNPVVSSFSSQCGANGVPTEHISLSYEKIKFEYTGFDSTKKQANPAKTYDLSKRQMV